MKRPTALSRVPGLLKRGLSARAGMSWLILALSLSAHGLVALSHRLIHPGLHLDPVQAANFYGPLVILAILAVCAFAVGRILFFRIIQILRSVIVIGFYTVADSPWGATALLLLAVVMDWVLYDKAIAGLVSACAVLTAATVLAIASSPSPRGALYGASVTLLGGAIVAVFGSRALAHRARAIEQEARIERLEGAVAKLSEANLGYQQHAGEAEHRSMIEERNRITREIHDIIGYTLTSNIMTIEAAKHMLSRNPGGVPQLLQTAREHAEEGFDQIRDSLHLLRAQEQPSLPPLNAIVRTVDVFRAATGISVNLALGNVPQGINGKVGDALWAVVQEGLTNAQRHGRASEIRISLWVDRGRILGSVWDNGRGSEGVQEGIGLAGMRERLQLVGGELQVDSKGPGFRLRVEIPMEQPRPTEFVDERSARR